MAAVGVGVVLASALVVPVVAEGPSVRGVLQHLGMGLCHRHIATLRGTMMSGMEIPAAKLASGLACSA